MSLSFDVYWSMRSPYCYLAGPRLLELTKRYAVTARVRPVYPHAVRMPEVLTQKPKVWLDYFRTDIVRTAAFLGMPIAWPRPDPVALTETGAASADQPLIRRLTHLAIAAEEAGAGLAFLVAAGAVMWSPDTSDWRAPGLLEAAAIRAGLDLAKLDAAITADPARFDATIQDNQQAEEKDGHWGVPLMVFEGEPFYGQDRIDQLIWRMRQRGLTTRS